MSPTGATRLTVAVCTAGRRPDGLRRVLDALARQREPADAVVVVDNSPDGRVGGWPVGDAVLVVHEPQRGLDHARNRAVQLAAGGVVAFVDDDCEPDPGWAGAVRGAFHDEEVACVTGRVVADGTGDATERWFELRFSFDRGLTPDRFRRGDDRPWFPVHPSHLGTGANMAFRAPVLAALGGFDPALDVGSLVGGGGDLDAFARILDAGHVAVYCPDALVRHRHRQRRRHLAAQFFGYGATVSALVLKAVLTRPGCRRAAVHFFAWYLRDELRRLGRRLFRRPDEEVPAYLFAAELAGHLWGPVGYLAGRLRATGRGT